MNIKSLPHRPLFSYLSGICCLCTLLAACNTVPTAPELPAVATRAPAEQSVTTEIDDLLAYYKKTRALPQAELAKLMADLNASTLPLKRPYHDMQKAIVLGFLRGNSDLLRAQVILDGILKSSEAESEKIKPLAFLLSNNYGEWRRLDDNIEKQNQQAKELQRRAEQLNQKLEDLKAIERQLPSRSRNPSNANLVLPPPNAEVKQ